MFLDVLKHALKSDDRHHDGWSAKELGLSKLIYSDCVTLNKYHCNLVKKYQQMMHWLACI